MTKTVYLDTSYVASFINKNPKYVNGFNYILDDNGEIKIVNDYTDKLDKMVKEGNNIIGEYNNIIHEYDVLNYLYDKHGHDFEENKLENLNNTLKKILYYISIFIIYITTGNLFLILLITGYYLYITSKDIYYYACEASEIHKKVIDMRKQMDNYEYINNNTDEIINNIENMLGVKINVLDSKGLKYKLNNNNYITVYSYKKNIDSLGRLIYIRRRKSGFIGICENEEIDVNMILEINDLNECVFVEEYNGDFKTYNFNKGNINEIITEVVKYGIKFIN